MMTAPHSIQPPNPTLSTFNFQADGVDAITDALRSLHLGKTHDNTTKPETHKTKPPPMSCMVPIKMTPPHSIQPSGQVQSGFKFRPDDVAAIVNSLCPLQIDSKHSDVKKPKTLETQPQDRKTKAQQTTAASPEIAQPPTIPSRLLGLPRELRDIIYDYALINRDSRSGGVINVSLITKPAALTQANRQIRSETLGVWWLKNRLRLGIVACDARLLSSFFRMSLEVAKVLKKKLEPKNYGNCGTSHVPLAKFAGVVQTSPLR